MKVTFIFHSSYLVELSHCYLLFDYYEGELPPLSPEKPLYVLASHSHPDHFSPAVFSLPAPGQKAFFLLSDDIFERRVPEKWKSHTLMAAPRRSYQIGDLTCSTLRSTDQGAAFLVQCEGKLFYHAGDLNCWAWDSAPAYQREAMKEAYREELSLLVGKEIFAAFVPLDPRLEGSYALGMKYFLETARASHVFPMHMWEDYSVVPRLKADPAFSPWAPLIMDVSRPGQSFCL